MNLHRLAEERSIELHRAVVKRIEAEPALIDTARVRIDELEQSGRLHPLYALRWRTVLARGLPGLVSFLVDPGEEARELRQVTPSQW